jgi:hypothetical protein
VLIVETQCRLSRHNTTDRRAIPTAQCAVTMAWARAAPHSWDILDWFGRWARPVLLGRGPISANALFIGFQFPKSFFLLKFREIHLSF